MNKHCEACPVGPGKACLGVDAPERFGHWCELAREGEQVHLRMIVGRSAMGHSPRPPRMLARVASLIGAVAGHIAKGAPTVGRDVIASRLAICRACENYSAAGSGPACLACGCGHQGLELKASWGDQACPIGKWGAVEAGGVTPP